MLLSRSHKDEAKVFSKRSTLGGELVASSTESRAILPSESNLDDSLEPNVGIQGPSAIIGERKLPASGVASHGRTMFRLLSPQWYDSIDDDNGTAEIDYDQLVGMFGEKAQIGVQSLAGVKVVIVSAKEEENLCDPTSPAVTSLINIHKYLMPSRAFSKTVLFETRLVVRNEQAIHIIRSRIFQTFQEDDECELFVYLSEYSLGLSVGYSIIELLGSTLDSVYKALEIIAFTLREIPPLEGESYGLTERIPFSRVVEKIIGESDANIKKLQEKRYVTFSISCPLKIQPNDIIINIEGALADVNDAEMISEGPNPIKVPRLFDVEQDEVEHEDEDFSYGYGMASVVKREDSDSDSDGD